MVTAILYSIMLNKHSKNRVRAFNACNNWQGIKITHALMVQQSINRDMIMGKKYSLYNNEPVKRELSLFDKILSVFE